MGLRVMEPARDDVDLVAASLAGDHDAFRRLVERYQDRLFGLARSYTKSAVEIEDIVQDAFMKAFRRLDTFNHESSFYTWLYRITLNTALDFLKRRGRSPVRAVEDPELGAPIPSQQGFAPSARMEREEIAEITRAVLEELPEIFRTVLVLRELQGLAYQEIADVLGISIGTVESRLFRARARFKDRILTRYPEYGQE